MFNKKIIEKLSLLIHILKALKDPILNPIKIYLFLFLIYL